MSKDEQNSKTSPKSESNNGETTKDDGDSDEIIEIPITKSGEKLEERKSTRQLRETILLGDEMKFMSDFDEKNSLRRQRKNRRRYYPDGRPIIHADDYEDCDCLRANCQGCHYPCPHCNDARCGQQCRNGRRWLYESVEVEGWSKVLKNKNLDNYGYITDVLD